ncbi:hypothetical protein [Leeuwenhoekiella sp. NPDC079379]|uniref:hypothetical protein n=1 Tax=Leeuwenhoekiella sp. NPDC079379 TaxID=3364122 RepID=UPI0037CA5B55
MKKILLSTFFVFNLLPVFAQVGIGTTTPEASLDIRAVNHLGAVTASDGVLVPRVNNLATNGSTDGQLIYLTASVSPYTKGFHYWDSGLSSWLPLNSTIEPWFKAKTTQPATLNTDNIYTMGQVGIGTNNPLGALHITTENSRDVLFIRFIDKLDDDLDLDIFRSRGTIAAPGLLQNDTRIGGLRGQALTNASTYAFKPSAEIYFQAEGASSSGSSSGKIKFATTPVGDTSTVDRMVIRANGFVGIGTNDPIEHVELKRAGDNDLQFTSASTNPPNVIFYNTGGTLDTPNLLSTNQEIGSLVFKTHDGTAIREVGGIRMLMDGTPAAGNLPTKIIFNTTAAGAVNQTLAIPAMTINNIGRVGIGVADPLARLDILGSIKIADGTQAAGRILTSDATGLATWQVPGANAANWSLQGNAVAATDFLGTTNAQPLNFRVNNIPVGSFKVDNSLQLGGETSSTAANATALGFQAKATAADATALGHNTSASGSKSITAGSGSSAQAAEASAYGKGAAAMGPSSTAIGRDSRAQGSNATSLGKQAQATANSALAIGPNTTASQSNSTALGNQANASAINTTSLGYNSDATADNATAVGYETQATGISSVAIGDRSVGNALNTIAIGYSSEAVATNALAIGDNAYSNRAFGLAIGYSADAQGDYSLALGPDSYTNQLNATALGRQSDAQGQNSIALGFDTYTNQTGSVAIGQNAESTGGDALALGTQSRASNGSAVALGKQAQATANSALALGPNTVASAENATAIGNGATAGQANTIILGNSSSTIPFNVGIGTNTPTAKLQVNGTLRYVDATPGDDNGKVLTSDANGNASWQAIPQVVAAGLVNPDGTALKITGATVSRINLGDYQVTFASPRSSVNYVVNLTTIDCMDSAECPYDDPGIAYYDRQATGFKINIGDSDNGTTQKADIDIEFSFSVIDF